MTKRHDTTRHDTTQVSGGHIAADAAARAYWHGGPRIAGDMLTPPIEHGRARVCHGDRFVYITPTRSLAIVYGATCNGWIYEIEPIGAIEQDPDSLLAPGESLRCERARILRRFKVSRRDVDRCTTLVYGLMGEQR